MRVEAAHVPEVVEGGDHSFNLPRSAAVLPAEVYRRMASRTVEWLAGLAG